MKLLFRTVGIAFIAGSAMASTDATAAPVTTTVKLSDIRQQLVPNTLVAGDREFGGNGPDIHCTATLYVTPDKRHIIANIDFDARETKSDWSETKRDWTRTVYTAPKDKTIDAIVDNVVSSAHFVSKPAGAQILGPSPDFSKFLSDFAKVSSAVLMFTSASVGAPVTPEQLQMKALFDKVVAGSAFLNSEGNHVHVVKPASGPVLTFAIVGDTGGPDISDDNDGKDDTRINAIAFRPLRVRLQ